MFRRLSLSCVAMASSTSTCRIGRTQRTRRATASGTCSSYNVGFARRLRNVLELSLQANGRSARGDDIDGISVENSGGSVVYAPPAARVFTSVGVVLEASAQFLVSRALNGEQGEHAAMRFALSLASFRMADARTRKLGMIWGTSQGPRPKGAWRVGVLRAPSRVWGVTGPGSFAVH